VLEKYRAASYKKNLKRVVFLLKNTAHFSVNKG